MSCVRFGGTGRPFAFGLLILFTACVARAPEQEQRDGFEGAPRVVLIIGDGAGIGHWSLLSAIGGSRTLDEFPVTGLVLPRGTSPRVIDSAASATAYAIGIASFNGSIGVGPDSAAHETVLEAAARAGLATGVVTTTSVTDATPAAFTTHVPGRGQQAEIAAAMLRSDVDVIMGDGLGWFDGSLRPDSQDLLRGDHGFTVVRSPEELANLDASTTDRLLGLFAPSGRPALDPAKPRLADMTRTALDIVARDPDGFFLLVESEGTDEASHANAPIDTLLAVLTDLDRAIQVALQFRNDNPGTLVIVTGDHETGGTAVHTARGGIHSVEYTTTGHTAAMVPAFATGPGATRFAGTYSGDSLGRMLRNLITP